MFNGKGALLRIKYSLQSGLMKFIQKDEQLINKVEYIRGLYRYPNQMLGRKCLLNTKDQNTDILVFAAHPDDDVLGLGTTLYRHSLNGENIKVVFVTNGSGRDGESWHIKRTSANKKAETRYREAVTALSLINIPENHVYSLGYPDGGTQRYLNHMSVDIQKLVKILKPGRIYVHCIEGGHGDHDLTSFVVKSICKKIGYHNVFEWTEYNPAQPLGTQDVKFLSSPLTKFNETIIRITEEERVMKRKMLACHRSQDVEQFFMEGEAIRQVDLKQIDTELMEHCQIPKRKLLPLLRKFEKFMKNVEVKTMYE